MRRIGIRFWLAAAFAAVALLTAGVVYLFGDRPRAVLGAIALGVLAGFLIALGISRRVRRLSSGAGELAAGTRRAGACFTASSLITGRFSAQRKRRGCSLAAD